MDLEFDLQLTERQTDRVWVSVLLQAKEEPVDVEGVEVMLVCPLGEPLSHRMLLPISGTISQRIVSTVELRGMGELPFGARIAGTVWSGGRQLEARIPADPGTQMQAHCQGHVCLRPSRDTDFEVHFQPISCQEREALATAFPWLEPCAPPELRVVDDPHEEDTLRAYCQDLGMDEEE